MDNFRDMSKFFFFFSRVFKSDMEIEVLRFANKISSDAHKVVGAVMGLTYNQYSYIPSEIGNI